MVGVRPPGAPPNVALNTFFGITFSVEIEFHGEAERYSHAKRAQNKLTEPAYGAAFRYPLNAPFHRTIFLYCYRPVNGVRCSNGAFPD